MKVRCINNTGKSIKKYEYKSLKKGQLGRFGATEHTQFGLEIGKAVSYTHLTLPTT